jgi:internalin A
MPPTHEINAELIDLSSIRFKIFVSYSHKDKRWRDELEIQLKPYLRQGSITSWSDEQIVAGSQWLGEIKSALAQTTVAVLLVTPDFLASDFIHEHESGPLLKEAEQGGVRILWVPVRDSAYKQTALKNYQAALDPNKPLATWPKAKRDQAWVKICEEIEKSGIGATDRCAASITWMNSCRAWF